MRLSEHPNADTETDSDMPDLEEVESVHEPTSDGAASDSDSAELTSPSFGGAAERHSGSHLSNLPDLSQTSEGTVFTVSRRQEIEGTQNIISYRDSTYTVLTGCLYGLPVAPVLYERNEPAFAPVIPLTQITDILAATFPSHEGML